MSVVSVPDDVLLVEDYLNEVSQFKTYESSR